MELISLNKVKDGKYLKNYELKYRNREGREKTYEIISRRELKSAEDLGNASSGVSIVAFCGEKLLLLKEFRLGVNRYVYNLCAGMQEAGEDVESCIKRELYEETGLQLVRIIDILPPSYSAVAITDISTQIVFAKVQGIPDNQNISANEEIVGAFYTKEEVKKLLDQKQPFSSRAQFAAYLFSIGGLDSMILEQKRGGEL